mmetsp:Transcript_29631/g.62923  ORF Transcript_29631/g.62923 Transcript_29631/m.62923 type:complete len:110 (-) Transcript_29631:465-794(-)
MNTSEVVLWFIVRSSPREEINNQWLLFLQQIITISWFIVRFSLCIYNLDPFLTTRILVYLLLNLSTFGIYLESICANNPMVIKSDTMPSQTTLTENNRFKRLTSSERTT